MRKGEPFYPSEVVRWMYPQAWRAFMDDVNEEMMAMYREGLILVTRQEQPVSKEDMPQGPVKICPVSKPNPFNSVKENKKQS